MGFRIKTINFMYPVFIFLALLAVLKYDVSWWVPGLIVLSNIELNWTLRG